jgi:hypothetical protein
MNQFLWGALCATAVIIASFFYRSWMQTRDRLFVFFFLAFVTLSIHWLGLAIVNPLTESRHYLFLLRLLAFGLILLAIIDKNRRAHAPR